MSARPGGVVALAIFFIIFGVLGIIGSIIYAILLAATSSAAMASSFLEIYALQSAGVTIDVTTLLAVLSFPISSASAASTTFIIVLLVSIVFAALYIITAVGLLRMKNWGRILALIFGILDIIGGIIGLLAIVGIIPLIFGIIVVVYLMGDVKHEFE